RALGEATVRAQVGARIQTLMDPRAAEVVLDLLQQGWLSQSSVLGSIAAFIVIAYGSTTGFTHLKTSLDKIFGEPAEEGPVLLRVLTNHAVAFLLVLLVGISVVVLVSLEALAAPILSVITGLSPSAVVVLSAFKPALSLAVLTTLFCLLFMYLPDRRPGWRPAALGALVTALLFLVGQVLIGLYLARALFVSAFGVAGSLVALMAWSYYSCMIVLLGAAVTAELVDQGVGPAEPVARGTDG
ncbi:MAG: YihY/virulence factor BrkB family protein, partial [Gemmatimonadota bacterium]